MRTAMTSAAGISVPNIAILVSVANIPPAGVKPPYINDWNPAANDPGHKVSGVSNFRGPWGYENYKNLDIPKTIPEGPNPRTMMSPITTVKVIHHTVMTARTSSWSAIFERKSGGMFTRAREPGDEVCPARVDCA